MKSDFKIFIKNLHEYRHVINNVVKYLITHDIDTSIHLTCMRKSKVEHCKIKAVSKCSNNFVDVSVESILATNSDQARSVSVPLIFNRIVWTIMSQESHNWINVVMKSTTRVSQFQRVWADWETRAKTTLFSRTLPRATFTSFFSDENRRTFD